MTAEATPRDESPRGWLKLLGWLVAIFAIMLVLGIGAALLAANTPWGRSQIAVAVSNLESVSVGKIDGNLFSAVTVSDIALSDAQGTWLTIPQANISWSVWPLLTRTVNIKDIQIPTVSVLRAPVSEPDPNDDSAPFELTDITAQPVSAVLNNLEIAEIIWTGASGQQDSVTVAATGALKRGKEVELALAVVPLTDGFDDEVNADIVLNTRTQAASTKLTLQASAGGLLASLLGLPGETNAALEGSGTPAQWAGSVKADVTGKTVADLKAQFQSPEGTATGTVFILPFMDADLTDIANTPFKLDTRFEKTGAQAIALSGDITNAALTTKISGLLSAPERKPTAKDLVIDTTITGTAADVRLDALSTKLTVNGQLEDLTAQLRLNAKTITAPAATLTALEINGSAVRAGNSITASAQGGVQSVSGIEGIDPDLLNALQFSADVKSKETLTATAQVNNRYFEIDASNISQKPDGALAADVAFSAPDLQKFPSAIEAALTGKATLAQSADGKTSIVLSSALTPQKGTQHWIGRLAQTPLTIKARAALSDGDISLPLLSLKSDRTDLTGKASLRGEAVDAAIKGTIAGAAFADLAPGAGDAPAQFNLTAKGPINTVMPRGTLTLPGLAAADIIMRDLQIEFAPQGTQTAVMLNGRSNAGPIKANALVGRFANGDIAVKDMTARLANVSAQGNIMVDAANGPAGDVTVAILPLTLAQSGLLGISGDMEVRAQLTGGSDSTLVLSGGGPLLTYGPASDPTAQLRNLELDGTVDLAADTPRLEATLNAQALEAAGLFFDSLSLTAQQDGSLQKAVATLKQGGPRPTDATFAVDVKASAADTILNISPSGQLAGAPLGSDGPITVTTSNEGVRIAPTTLTIGGGTVGLRAQQTASALNAAADIKGFQLRTITDLLQQPAYMGELSSTLELTAKQGTGNMSATFKIADLSADAAAQAKLSLNGTAQASESTFITDIAAGQSAAMDDVTARFELPITWPQTPSIFTVAPDAPLKGDIALDTRLAPWWQLADLVDQTLSGVVKGNIALRGTLEKLEPKGKISISETRYEHMEFGTQINDLTADITLQNKQIALESLSANDGRGGTVSASALLDLFPAAPQRSQIILKDFQLVAKDGLSARADADLALAPSNGRLGLKGDITIAEARYAIAVDGAAAVPTLPIEEINKGTLDGQDAGKLVDTGKTESTQDTGLPTLDLDIDVSAPKRIFVTGMGLTSEWKTQLDVTGTADTPNIAGSVQLVRGELEFAGKRFQLERGQIFLDGGDQVEPRLDILAQNVQGDFTARIGITGTPSDPKITLSSTPSLPDDEILSRILFGTSAADLSALEAVQLGSAVAALSSGGGSSALDIAGKARSATGLDRLSLGSNDSSTAITGGKYLSEDVYLQFTTDPGTGQYLAAIEWYLTKTLSVLSEYGAQTGSNVAARWSRTY